MLENSSTLAVSSLINFSLTLGFVSVNAQRETYFVDILSNYMMFIQNLTW